LMRKKTLEGLQTTTNNGGGEEHLKQSFEKNKFHQKEEKALGGGVGGVGGGVGVGGSSVYLERERGDGRQKIWVGDGGQICKDSQGK